MHIIVLKDGTTVEAENVMLSRTGKSYVAYIGECTCYKNTCDCIKVVPYPVNDIATLDGKEVEPYIPKSINYNHSKWKVTKTWVKDGYRWFKISGSAGGGTRYYKILGKNQLEEWGFWKATKKERAKGAPMVISRCLGEPSIPIEKLREIYKTYQLNKQLGDK